MTVQEGIDLLSMLCVHHVKTGGQTACALVPEPSAQTRKLLDLVEITLPARLPRRKIRVATGQGHTLVVGVTLTRQKGI